MKTALILTSTNEEELAAATNAVKRLKDLGMPQFADASILTVNVESATRNCPTREEACYGAYMRADGGLDWHGERSAANIPQADTIISLGIHGGIDSLSFRFDSYQTIDVVCALRNDGASSATSTMGVEVASDIAEKIVSTKKDQPTVAESVAAEAGDKETIAYLSNGTTSRIQLLTDAIATALAQLVAKPMVKKTAMAA